MKLSIIFVLLCITIYYGLYFFVLYDSRKQTYSAFDEENWVNPLDNARITDNRDIYKDDVQTKPDEIYVTVLKPKEYSGEQTCSFQDLLAYSEDNEETKPEIEVYFQDGNNSIINNGIFIREPNAVMGLKGKSQGKDIQKSFKIRLYDREGLWHNQNIINLNKDYSDPLRIRNKLSFDYFAIIPDITSLRTRFVTLFIKDLSAEPPDEKFENYGLFTQVEQPNKLFLTNHRLDSNGHLYEAENFKFLRYPQNIKNKGDSGYSKKDFEEILEIQGNEDHQKLIDMLEAVNDCSIDIDQIIETYFDRENYLTWLAANILFDNYGISDTNFLLYSPLNSNKWYFMPYDYDEAWGLGEDRPKWQKGISMCWDNVLHRRFLLEPENVEALSEKIEELSTIVNEEQTRAFLDAYYDIILSSITALPDLKYLPVTLEEYRRQYEDMPRLTERNRLYYYELLENPMPFYLMGPEQKGNKYLFTWTGSYDIQGDSLSYDFELSRDKDFSSVVTAFKDIVHTGIEIQNLKPGVYYWRVTAKDAKGNSQIAFNIYRDPFGDRYYGIKKFEIDRTKALNISDEEDVWPVILDDAEENTDAAGGNTSSGASNSSGNKSEEGRDTNSEHYPKDTSLPQGNTQSNQGLNDTYDYYIVKAGDTLYSISMKFYGTKRMIEVIRELNDIEDIYDIPVGTVLKLP